MLICTYIYTFCPLIVTVEGIAHQSMQAFLKRIAARLSAKWQKPLSTVTNWMCPRAVRARQNGGSAHLGLLEEVQEPGVQGW